MASVFETLHPTQASKEREEALQAQLAQESEAKEAEEEARHAERKELQVNHYQKQLAFPLTCRTEVSIANYQEKVDEMERQVQEAAEREERRVTEAKEEAERKRQEDERRHEREVRQVEDKVKTVLERKDTHIAQLTREIETWKRREAELLQAIERQQNYLEEELGTI